MRSLDWSTTSLGPVDAWPAPLKAAVNLMLPAQAQIVLFWGDDFTALYNDAYAPSIGDKHPRALGRPAHKNWAELWDDLEPLLRRVIDTGETVVAKDRPFYIERHGYPEDVYFDISYSPVHDDAGAIGGVLCIVSETTERVVAQRQLVRAQERLTQALNAGGMVGTFDWHINSDVMYTDAHFAELFSVDPEKGEQGAPLSDYLAGVHSEDVDRIAEAVSHTVKTGERFVQEYRLRRKDGAARWVEARGERINDEAGEPARFVGVVVDITAQKEAQERQKLLLLEMDHRVKNLLAVFRGLIRSSARSARTPVDLAEALSGRVEALMRAKELVRPGLLGTEHATSERSTLDALVRTVLQPYEDLVDRRTRVCGPEIAVGPAATTSLALALHETATNAAKYGALSAPDGKVRVEWSVQGGQVLLEWEESGGPSVVAPKSTGFGNLLTDRSIAGQLGGSIAYDWRPDGLKLTAAMPLARLLA
ncbi:MAG: PAS domain-containing protein [Hyphomicrobiales bacterium]|nr:PAS domain-containing protein [Hyphomicrobiales bacterium]